MSVTVGGVVIKLLCDSAQFQKEWDNTSRTLKRTEREWNRTGTMLTRSITKPLLLAGAAALAYQINWRNVGVTIGKSISKHSQDLDGLRTSLGHTKDAAAQLGDAFARAVAPGIDAASRAMIPLLNALAKVTEEFAKSGQTTQQMIVSLALVAMALGPIYKLGALILKTWRAIGAIKWAIPFSAAAGTALSGVLLAVGAAIVLCGLKWNDWNSQIDKTPDKIGKVKDYVDKLVASTENLQLFPRAEGGGSSDAEVAGFLQPFIDQAKAAAEAFKNSEEAAASLAMWLRTVDDMYGKMAPKWNKTPARGGDTMPIGAPVTGPSMDAWRTYSDEFIRRFEDMEAIVQEWGNEWADTVSQAIVDGRLLQLNFGNFFRQIAADIMYMILKLKMIDPIVKSIMDRFGISITKGLTGGEGGEGTGTGSGSIPGYPNPSAGPSLGLNVQIIDNRAMGDQVKVTRKGNTLQVLVEDAVGRAINAGRLDPAMATSYGMRRQSVRR
jgi:hypothetical protein